MSVLQSEPSSPTRLSAPRLGTGGTGSSSTSTSSGNAPRSLALKISRLLSASLEDAGTRSALETLDEFNLVEPSAAASAGGSGGTKAGDEGKTAKTRRLRAEVDKRLLQDSFKFLEAFKQVNDKLTELQGHLSTMHNVVDNVQTQLSTANSGTKHLLSSAASLRAERLATSDKQAIVTVFLKRFTLSEKEVKAMTSRDVPVGRELFEAIRRTEEIRSDCRVLLSGEASEEAKAGMEVMLITSQHLDSAFSKLHKYTSFAARNYTTRPEVLDNVSPTLRRSLQLLKINRSDLFDDALSVLSSTRSSAISNMFVEALTRGVDASAGGAGSGKGKDAMAARPIELHAHDPIRYVGDILAWVHQAMAGEREFLESLFGLKETGRRVGAARPSLPENDLLPPPTPSLSNASTTSDEARIRTLLDKNLEGCGRPMRIRIQQTIKSHSLISSITIYQIFQLLQFYRVLMKKTMGSTALLVKTLSELSKFAYDTFFETLNDQGESLFRSITAPGMDLKPSIPIRDSLSTLKEIMQVHKQSLLDEEDRSELDDFEVILEAALSPVLELMDKMKEFLKGGIAASPESEKGIFECNVLGYILSTLEGFKDFTKDRIQSLEQRLKERSDELTTLHYTHLLKESGLEPILTALHSKSETDLLSSIPAASSRNLSQAIRTFDSFLSHIDTLSSSRLSLLTSHRLANQVHRDALKRVVDAYSELYDAVSDDKNGYEQAGKGMLYRSKEEVGTLLNA